MPTNQNIFAFDKIDGSNIRAEWTPKSGFTKFGTRRRLLDPNEEPLGEAVALILETQADALSKIFRKQGYQRTTAFFEFAGAHSFAGQHEDDEHTVKLIDVHLMKQGFLPPKEYVKLFEDKVPMAELVYEGKANQDFVESVRNSTLEGMTFEGVVCKGGVDKHGNVARFKVKSKAWLDQLKHKYADNEAMFELLK